MKVELRKVNYNQLVQLQKIALDTFVISFAHLNDPVYFQEYVDEKLSIIQLEKELADKDSIFYFLMFDNEIKGYLKVNRLAAQTEQYVPSALEIERIYLLPECQGRNIGKTMIDKAREIAIEEGYTHLWLGVWEENVDAIRFYKREGFKVFDKHAFMMGRDKQTDLMMKLEL